MDNYEFCADFAARHGKRVLDYGCGSGRIVELLLKRNVDAYGCDVFYEGGDYSPHVRPTLASRIKRMEGDRIPFPDSFFDAVTHNQVFEHVPDIHLAASEIARVLKPGGLMLGLFPDRSVWREGHCGVPFLHWFPKGSAARVYYALAFRTLGFGYHHGNKTRLQWSQEFCAWLDAWTYYRSYREIREAFSRHFGQPTHIEPQWLDARLRVPLPDTIKTAIVHRLAGLVFWCERRADKAARTVVC